MRHNIRNTLTLAGEPAQRVAKLARNFKWIGYRDV